MSKLALPLVGLGGAGAAGLGGYTLFKKFEETPKEQTFQDKYSHAILTAEDSLWTTKFKDLKDGSKPAHSKLVEAQTKFKTSDSDPEAQRLQKEGCQEIYNFPIKDSNYLQDFQKYCAKLIGNGVAGTWIVADNTNSSKWDAKLNSLKAHDESQNGSLDEALEALKGKLNAASESGLDNNKRGELKKWCDSVKGEIFIGDKDSRLTHAKLYCVENS
ncbi:hypothetical protein HF1_08860 [Mycoplasma haemofelis str. Langford 1]|uniref:Uncharacterized protein n=1 Tax=Mycoplasma haemofelis (strain Langford 1) TaxID=941640 RepID=E8ZIC3_MYCHL|nr:hypothetical protein [Mycoplasma haemofelis]CBY92894.1 hypothetical protein HF1_08860 [Mycoplasma haemofelis str. Langford 1]